MALNITIHYRWRMICRLSMLKSVLIRSNPLTSKATFDRTPNLAVSSGQSTLINHISNHLEDPKITEKWLKELTINL